MPLSRRLALTDAQRRELLDLRDHAPEPYLRERAAALLKIAAGMPTAVVARQGLLRTELDRFLHQFASGSVELLRYVGLLIPD